MISLKPISLQSRRMGEDGYSDFKGLILANNLAGFVSALDKVDGSVHDPPISILWQWFDKNGCTLLHWAFGAPQTDVCEHILCTFRDLDLDISKLVNTRARGQSKDRTPAHYAARNGSISNLRLLALHGGTMDSTCKGGVTPFQLGVWRCELECVKFLVEQCGVDPLQTNDYCCGAVHWLGLTTRGGQDGSKAVEMGEYLSSLGCDFGSSNTQSQGHTSLHKAAWGGQHENFLLWLRDKKGVWDTATDCAGNFSADLAGMNRHDSIAEFLRDGFSDERRKSCEVLGVDVSNATEDEIRKSYLKLAKVHHPDAGGNEADFDRIKKAFDHLVLEGGKGSQKNTKHQRLELITAGKVTHNTSNNNNNGSDEEYHIKRVWGADGDSDKLSDQEFVDDDLFKARLLIVLSDFGSKGFPISNVQKRWNQIWPNSPFPPPSTYTATRVNKKGQLYVKHGVKLLEFLKDKCADVVRFEGGKGGVMLAFEREKR